MGIRFNCDIHGYVLHGGDGRCIECGKDEANKKRQKFLADRALKTVEDRLAALEADLYDLRMRKISPIVFG